VWLITRLFAGKSPLRQAQGRLFASLRAGPRHTLSESPGNERVFRQEESEGMIWGFGDADAGCGYNFARAKTVVANPQAGCGRGQVTAIIAVAGDPKGFGQAAGTTGEFAEIHLGLKGYAAGPSHFFDTGEGLEGTEKNGSCLAFGLAGYIQAVMVAVDEIDVGVAGRPEQHRGAGRVARGGMGGGIVFAEVGFDLDDTAEQAQCRALAD